MLENIYTTKMSANKKQLQNRFTKIRSKNGRSSKLMALTVSVVIAVTMLCATIVMAAFDSFERYEAKIFYNNEAMEFNNRPFFYGRTVYLPLRELFDNLDLTDISKIKWNNGNIQIKIDGHKSNYQINIGQNKIVYDNFWNNTQSDVLTPTSPVLMNGITYIPFEYVERIINRYNYNYDVSFTFGNIDSKTPYLGNAEMKTYSYLCDLQYQVDNGHFPWRLDAQQVIKSFFTNQGMENGEITSLAGNGVSCSATYTFDGVSYIIELFKPVQTDEHGIWIVKEYYNANPHFTDGEINSARAVVQEYFNAKIPHNKEAIIATLTKHHNAPNVIFWQDEKIELNNIELDLTDEIKNRYLTNGRGQVNGVSEENVIVFKVDFTVSYNENEKSAYNVGRYTDYAMILIREDASGNWLIDDMGY